MFSRERLSSHHFWFRVGLHCLFPLFIALLLLKYTPNSYTPSFHAHVLLFLFLQSIAVITVLFTLGVFTACLRLYMRENLEYSPRQRMLIIGANVTGCTVVYLLSIYVLLRIAPSIKIFLHL